MSPVNHSQLLSLFIVLVILCERCEEARVGVARLDMWAMLRLLPKKKSIPISILISISLVCLIGNRTSASQFDREQITSSLESRLQHSSSNINLNFNYNFPQTATTPTTNDAFQPDPNAYLQPNWNSIPNEPKISTDRWNIDQQHHRELTSDQKYYSKLVRFSQSWNVQKPLTNSPIFSTKPNNDPNFNQHQQSLINIDDDEHNDTQQQPKNAIALSTKPISTSPLLSMEFYGLRKKTTPTDYNNQTMILSTNKNNQLLRNNLENDWQPSTDIDECLDERACGKGALCENLPGSFKCTCPPGFTGDPSVECIGKCLTNILVAISSVYTSELCVCEQK